MSGNNEEVIYKEVADSVIRFQGGDTGAFDDFYELTKRFVYCTVRDNTKTSKDVDDLVQDVYLKAFTELKKLKNPRAAVKWINKVAYRTAINNNKSKYNLHEQLAEAQDDGKVSEFDAEDSLNFVIPAPEDIMENRESQKILRAMIDQLSDKQKQVVFGYFFLKMSYEEIANATNENENTTKSHMFRAKKALRANIEAYSKRYGVTLRSIAAIPVLSMLFHKEVEAAEVPEALSASVMSAVSRIAAEAPAAGAHTMNMTSSAQDSAQSGNPAEGIETGSSNGPVNPAEGTEAGVSNGPVNPSGISKVGGTVAAAKTGISKLAVAGIVAGFIALVGITATVFNGSSGTELVTESMSADSNSSESLEVENNVSEETESVLAGNEETINNETAEATESVPAVNQEGNATESQTAVNAFVPVIFELHEGVENRVTLGLTETEDVISFNANGGNILSGKINDMDFSIQAGEYVDQFASAYAVDFNTKDGYKNLVVYFLGESDNMELSICAYNESEVVLLDQQFTQISSVYGSPDGSYPLIDEQHIPQDGTILLETSTNWKQGDKTAVVIRTEYSVNGAELFEVDSYAGYYSGYEFVKGYPLTLYSDLPVYEDESGANRIGTIPGGTEVILERGRYNFYLSGGGLSGWAMSSDITQAIKGEGFKGWA
jgi:RNA polymerase sigma-70 factor (ECF subfamily)